MAINKSDKSKMDQLLTSVSYPIQRSGNWCLVD